MNTPKITQRLFTLLLVFVLLGLNLPTARAQSQQLVTSSTAWVEQIPAAIPTARYSHAMAFDSRRNVVVLFGGIAGVGPSDATNDTYELVDGVWVKRTPLHSPPGWYGGNRWHMIPCVVKSPSVARGYGMAPIGQNNNRIIHLDVELWHSTHGEG